MGIKGFIDLLKIPLHKYSFHNIKSYLIHFIIFHLKFKINVNCIYEIYIVALSKTLIKRTTLQKTKSFRFHNFFAGHGCVIKLFSIVFLKNI